MRPLAALPTIVPYTLPCGAPSKVGTGPPPGVSVLLPLVPMATETDLDDAWGEARLALLKRIAAEATGATGENLKNLAEAYAWLTSVNQDH